MTTRAPRLRSLGWIWTGAAFASGLLSAGLWFSSARAWDNFLTRAYVAGFSVYEELRVSKIPPPGITITPLSPEAAQLADAGRFEQLPGLSDRSFVTNLSILTDNTAPLAGRELTLAVMSDRLVYPVSDLLSRVDQTGAEKMGNLTRLLAT